MPLPPRLIKILLKKGFKNADGKLDLFKIASTESAEILNISGIGDLRLQKIADELESQEIITAQEWIKGKTLSEKENSKVESEVELEYTALDVEIPENIKDVYFKSVGPSTLDDKVFKWLHNNVGLGSVDYAIKEQVQLKGLTELYELYLELDSKLGTSDIQYDVIIKYLIAYNFYTAQETVGVAFEQGYWKSSLIDILYREANGIPVTPIKKDHFSNTKNKILSRLQRLGYDIHNSKYLA